MAHTPQYDDSSLHAYYLIGGRVFVAAMLPVLTLNQYLALERGRLVQTDESALAAGLASKRWLTESVASLLLILVLVARLLDGGDKLASLVALVCVVRRVA